MCIALLSTAHPEYPLILIDNRDEFLSRPTASAAWWDSPHEHVLGGRDLQRPIKGTWLGVTKQGRIAVLTNFREEGQEIVLGKSRGAMVLEFLKVPPDSDETTAQFAKRLVDEVGVQGCGGFSLVFGNAKDVLEGKGGLAIISNRTEDAHSTVWICEKPGEVHGLSNSHYGDQQWPKVVDGERLTRKAIEESVAHNESSDQLVERLFDVLSTDTLPRPRGDEWEVYARQLRNSIFIPPVGDEGIKFQSADRIAAAKDDHQPIKFHDMVYGTQRQTVVLVRKDGLVTFVERALFDEHVDPLPKDKQDREYEFTIER